MPDEKRLAPDIPFHNKYFLRNSLIDEITVKQVTDCLKL
jgi:hypothetical protein